MRSSYKDLRVWHESMELTVAVYGATEAFPRHELYGLADQLRRAAVSVPSNIAEGKGYRSDLDFKRFLFHARGSLLEVETQICLAQRLQYISGELAESLLSQTSSIARGLNALINSLSRRSASAND